MLFKCRSSYFSFSDLPPELVDAIVSFLLPWTDALTLSRTSRSMRHFVRCCEGLWAPVMARRFPLTLMRIVSLREQMANGSLPLSASLSSSSSSPKTPTSTVAAGDGRDPTTTFIPYGKGGIDYVAMMERAVRRRGGLRYGHIDCFSSLVEREADAEETNRFCRERGINLVAVSSERFHTALSSPSPSSSSSSSSWASSIFSKWWPSNVFKRFRRQRDRRNGLCFGNSGAGLTTIALLSRGIDIKSHLFTVGGSSWEMVHTPTKVPMVNTSPLPFSAQEPFLRLACLSFALRRNNAGQPTLNPLLRHFTEASPATMFVIDVPKVMLSCSGGSGTANSSDQSAKEARSSLRHFTSSLKLILSESNMKRFPQSIAPLLVLVNKMDLEKGEEGWWRGEEGHGDAVSDPHSPSPPPLVSSPFHVSLETLALVVELTVAAVEAEANVTREREGAEGAASSSSEEEEGSGKALSPSRLLENFLTQMESAAADESARRGNAAAAALNACPSRSGHYLDDTNRWGWGVGRMLKRRVRTQRPWRVQGASATLDRGVREGLLWLEEAVRQWEEDTSA